MKALLIFSGANDRAIIAFCRYAESAKINYGIIANGKDDLIFLTNYKKKIISIRKRNLLTLDIIFQNVEILKSNYAVNEVFILPSTEYLNRFLLNNEKILNSNKITFGLCYSELYFKISDKYDFGSLCKNYGIKLPKEFENKPNAFPYVIKPKKYFDSKLLVNFKPAIITTIKEEQGFLLDKEMNEMYFQEYIGGKSIYLLFYFSKNGSYSVYSQENLIQQHNGGSIILCKSSSYHHDTKLVNSFTKLFINEGFNGLVMVEVKSYKGKYYMIEANPRLWGPSQLIIDAQMSLFDDFSIENDLTDRRNKNLYEFKDGVIYFWSGGLRETQKANSDFIAHEYDKYNFLKNYPKILQNEIYLKKDTLGVYFKENA